MARRAQRHLTVADTARLLDVDSATVLRAIHHRALPAVFLHGRYLVPGEIVDLMIEWTRAGRTWPSVLTGP